MQSNGIMQKSKGRRDSQHEIFESPYRSYMEEKIATAQIPFEGEIYNISLLRRFLTAGDRTVRRSAWKALSDYFLSVTDEIDEIFDKMVKNRTAQARMLEYENYIELGYCRMDRNSYGRVSASSQYKKMMDEDFTAAWESYKKLCRLSARKFYVPMLQEVGLESPFADGCVEAIVRHFEKKI